MITIKNFAPAILIVSPSWVGDMVMAQSLFRVLKTQQPSVHIDLIAPAWSQSLLERMPEVRHIFPLAPQHGQLALYSRYRIGKSLKPYHYQQAIVLPNSWKSALIPFWAKIPQRTGFIGEFRYGLLNDWRKHDKHQLKRTVDQFVALGLPATTTTVSEHIAFPQLSTQGTKASLTRFQLLLDQPMLALCPGAEYGEAKRWPAEYFATVARQMIEKGWQISLLGSHKDKPITATIAASVNHSACHDLAGQTTLAQVIDIISLSEAVITNDSGLMHVAAALNKPLIAIYGSSDPQMTPPLTEQACILSLHLNCSPCFQRTCRYGHLDCLKNIKPETVLATLLTFATSK